MGPHSPDRARPVSKLAAEVAANGWPAGIKAALIGSCTNSSYEDMRRAAHIAMQGIRAGLRARTPFLVTPGSERIYQTIRRDGIMATFEQMGGTVLANACGPCIGQWKRGDVGKDEANTIVSSFNRNFPGRNDGSQATLSFLTSPEIVTALAFAGTLEFDPVHGTLTAPDGKAFRFTPPEGEELPREGFARGEEGYEAPAADGAAVQVVIRPDSERLQLLRPFPRWDGKDFDRLPILVKTKGKTTTDHISPAGAWLRFRGHLDKISDNMFLGAVNAFTGETGKGVNVLTGEAGVPFTKIARDWKAKGVSWVVVGDENYGEGSSREHAAMSPRYLGREDGPGQELRAHPRDESEEAGDPAPDVRGPQGLRPVRAGGPGERGGPPGPGAGPARRGPDLEAGWPDRHDPGPPQPDRGAHRLVPRRVGAERALVGSSGRRRPPAGAARSENRTARAGPVP